ncbi:MAG: SDR family oxidoreductase [Elusimicrobiota bacterium]
MSSSEARNMRKLKTILVVLALAVPGPVLAAAEPAGLAGKVAIVTGSSSGIGRALAYRAAKSGMKLVLADIDLPGSQRVAEDVRKGGGEAIALRADVSVEKDREALVRAAVEAFGGVHVLFNNAGYGYMASQENIAMKGARHQFDVNFFAYVDLAQRVIPHMKRAKGGTIVNVASVLGLTPGSPFTSMYTASKHAVVGWGRTIAQELEDDGIAVKVVCPAGVKTNFHRNMKGKDAESVAELMRAGWKSMAEPEDVAEQIFSGMARPGVLILPRGVEDYLPAKTLEALAGE